MCHAAVVVDRVERREPRIYYVGLLAGGNDLALLQRTGVGRDINRHYYTEAELQRELTRPVVRSLLELLRMRNAHPAFQGTFEVFESASDRVALGWNQDAFARLDVDLTEMWASITCWCAGAQAEGAVTWRSAVEARA